MKRVLTIVAIIVGLGALSSLAWVGISRAADVRSGNAPSVGKSETIEGSVYIAGSTVSIDGTVKGDVFCAGQNVFITGKVEGDVICAGQTVRVSGTVMGDVRVAGQDVHIGGSVDGSATIAAQTVDFLSDAKIGRDLTVWGETARIEGQIGRDVVGGGSQVILGATVGRNVQFEADNLALEQKAAIAGDLAYRSPEQARVDQGATIGGATNYQPTPAQQRYDGSAVALWSMLYGFGSLLLIGLAAIAIAPRWFDTIGAAIRTRPLSTFGLGAVALIGVPIAAILLMVTVVGIPVGFIGLLVWLAALIASFAVTSYAIGWMIIEKLDWPNRGRRITSLVVGLALLGVVGLIPVIGSITRFAALVFGLGAIVMAIGLRLRPGAKKAVKEAKA